MSRLPEATQSGKGEGVQDASDESGGYSKAKHKLGSETG